MTAKLPDLSSAVSFSDANCTVHIVEGVLWYCETSV